MRRLNKAIELPEGEDFSAGLRSLVTYTLSPNAQSRPSMRNVLEHEYLLNTEESYPTKSLTELVNVYYDWLYSGGQRTSLFMAGGAAVSDAPGSIITPDDEWNFSTTDVFEKRISTILNIPSISEFSDLHITEGDITPKALNDPARHSLRSEDLTPAQKANFEERVRRGADLSNIFDPNKPKYEYKTKTDFVPVEERRPSDLPFRAMAEDRPSSIASNVIDLGDFDSSNYAIIAPTKEETITLADAATIRAKRGDSKGPRERSSTEGLTAKRISSTDDQYPETMDEAARPSTQNYSFPPKEWKEGRAKALKDDSDNTTHVSTTREKARKTMEWSFDSAMSDVETEDSDVASDAENKAKKHATMQWSFSDAMAEAQTSTIQSTTARPAPPLRTVTQPVTSSEIGAAEADVPRRSTALSDVPSESETSQTGSEIDPFSLDPDTATGYPAPGSLDSRGISSFYNTEAGSLSPEYSVPYNSTVAGPTPYSMGMPSRLGEPGFPGPSSDIRDSLLVAADAKEKKKRGKKGRGRKGGGRTFSSPGEESESGSAESPGGRQTLTAPQIVPPSQEALDAQAPPEVLEAEASRLLSGLNDWLGAAGQAVAGLGRRRRRYRKSESEWEDEE